MQKMPQTLGRAALVLEVVVDRSSRPQWLQVVTSMPGREGSTTKTWGLCGQGMDAAVTQDMALWIDTTLMDFATMVCGGVQGQLL